MATREAILSRQIAADDRVTKALVVLTRRANVAPADGPGIPRGVASELRAAIQSEVLADTLERLVAAGEPKPEGEQPDGEPKPVPKTASKAKATANG